MENKAESTDDLMLIIEDDDQETLSALPSHTWRILVVDDDADVHEATTLALKGLIVEDRALELIHAYSAKQAQQCLTSEQDISVVLLDVVMETEHAGLDLVEVIREQLELKAIRIILRTGQPGYAPEMETIRRYDINDYRTKPELTRIRLFTILTSAIRAYKQIRNQQIMRQGLEKVVKASTELAHLHGLKMFAEGAVKQISAIIQIEPDGLICVQEPSTNKEESAQIIAAAGRYRQFLHSPLDTLDSHRIKESIMRCLTSRTSLLETGLTLYFSTEQGRGLAAYVDIHRPLEDIDRHLLEVFCANLSVGFDNVLLYNKLEEQAFTDPLLRIPNLNSLLRYQLSNPELNHSSLLALVDIDDFSAFNDSFGHKVGDLLLKAVARRLTLAFPNCFITRGGSDVFALIGSADEMDTHSILNVFDESFFIDNQPFKIMASVGEVELNTDDNLCLSERYKDAQVALKQAKLHHRGSVIHFSKDMGQCARDRMLLLTELKEALDNNALFLMYQPKYHLESLRLTGVEALLRWRNKNGDLVPPDQFIPLAEQSGMMISIGKFVLKQACQQFHQLLHNGYPDITIAINVSPAQLEEPDFCSNLKNAMQANNIPPEQVEVEVTETIAANNLDDIQQALNRVRALGCKVAIDDFGTGFSSLSILHTLPATRLKIDRTFVDAMEQDDSIAKMIVNLGQTLGMEITAEGIETQAQYEQLKAFKCEEGQGWLFAKAMELDELIAFLAKPMPND